MLSSFLNVILMFRPFQNGFPKWFFWQFPGPYAITLLMLRRTFVLGAGLGTFPTFCQGAPGTELSLVERTHRGKRWTTCQISLPTHPLGLFYAGRDGRPLRDFKQLETHVAAQGQKVQLAMNAGMFENDGSPVGWCVAEGKTIKAANGKEGSGNFFLKPNGVFAVENGKAMVMETGLAVEGLKRPSLATQSGPLLTEAGKIHPAFNEKSVNRKIRNAVGVTQGGAVWLAISEDEVTFHESATLFRDDLGCPDALFLDEVVSRLHAPGLGRKGGAAVLGPLLAVTVPL
jgi:uncharacterized protein YigE (DUF2233 family)